MRVLITKFLITISYKEETIYGGIAIMKCQMDISISFLLKVSLSFFIFTIVYLSVDPSAVIYNKDYLTRDFINIFNVKKTILIANVFIKLFID